MSIMNYCSCLESSKVSHSPPNQPNKLPTVSFQASMQLKPFPSKHFTTTQNNILLASYLKSKPLNETLRLFFVLPHRDTVTWNTVISACNAHSRHDHALLLFVEMLQLSSPHQLPDNLTLRLVLSACIQMHDIPTTHQILGYIIKLQGLCSQDLILNTCLVRLCCELRLIGVARELFDRFPLRDIVAFTTMMVGYNDAGEFVEVCEVFRELVESDSLVVNEFAFTSALRAASALSSEFEGKQIHACVVKRMLQSDVFVGTALVDMYVKCNEIEHAKVAFWEIKEPNVAAWNALMAGGLAAGEALELFARMRLLGVSPDHVTFACVLRACQDVNLFLVRQLHGLVTKTIGPEVDVFVGGALFERYIDLGCICDAKEVFDGLDDKDAMAFNLAIQAYINNGHRIEAVSVLHEVLALGEELSGATFTSFLTRNRELKEGQQLHALFLKILSYNGNASIAGALITMYSKFHCLDDASRVFSHIHCPDLVLWTSLISGFTQNGENQEALKLYKLMVSEQRVDPPNHYTFSCVLHSCANLSALEEGKQLHAQIFKSSYEIKSDVFVASGLVDMYAKSGCITEARGVFDKMPEQDVASWNTMIGSLSQHGCAEDAIKMFHELLCHPNLKPNDITFVNVLTACSHGGLVDEGHKYFLMIKEPNINHYTCLVDLLGRAGHLEEARNVIQEMPFEPNEHIWSSLLSACRIHGSTQMGEYAAGQLLLLNPNDPGTYVALSNIYAAAGQWEDANEIRKLMRGRILKKQPGISWVGLNGKTHVFYAKKELQC